MKQNSFPDFTLYALRVITYFVCIPYSIAAHSQIGQAFSVVDENPFLRIFGLPKPESAKLTATQQLNVRLSFSVSNSSIHEQNANEEIVWDGESSIYEAGFRYGVNPKLALGLDIPLVMHSGGVLDSAIQRYHKITGLSNTRQQQFDKNQIHYQYSSNGVSQYELNSSTHGLGDIRLIGSWQLESVKDKGRQNVSVSSMLKLPTGNSSTLLGSGGTDISFSFSYHNPSSFSQYNTSLLANLGILRMGKAEVLSNIQRPYARFCNLTLIWHFNQWVDVKSQLDYHSPFYNSHLKHLGADSIKLDLGANIKLADNQHLDVGMTQNLRTDTTADLGLFVMYQNSY